MIDENKVIAWIKKQVKIAGAKGIVYGLSGGIDSSVVAVLVKKAMGSRHLALILPCQSRKKDINDAILVSGKFKLNTETINLSQIYEAMIKLLPKGSRVARGNLKARLRMCVLYFYANKYNFLVCGTGNRTELALGYFTKYGDGGVDILPLGDMLKREVKQLASSLKVPQRIIDKPPTAGLWPGQTDERDLGLSYDKLDNIIANMPYPKDKPLEFRKIKKLIDKSCHKRETAKVFSLH